MGPETDNDTVSPVSTKHFRSWSPNRAFIKTAVGWTQFMSKAALPLADLQLRNGSVVPFVHKVTNKAVISSLALSIIHSSPVPGRIPTLTGDVTHSPTLITRAPAPRGGISLFRTDAAFTLATD